MKLTANILQFNEKESLYAFHCLAIHSSSQTSETEQVSDAIMAAQATCRHTRLRGGYARVTRSTVMDMGCLPLSRVRRRLGYVNWSYQQPFRHPFICCRMATVVKVSFILE